MNVVLAPLVSQLPVTVHAPVVTVIVPTPTRVTFPTDTVAAFALKSATPDTAMLRFPIVNIAAPVAVTVPAALMPVSPET